MRLTYSVGLRRPTLKKPVAFFYFIPKQMQGKVVLSKTVLMEMLIDRILMLVLLVMVHLWTMPLSVFIPKCPSAIISRVESSTRLNEKNSQLKMKNLDSNPYTLFYLLMT